MSVGFLILDLKSCGRFLLFGPVQFLSPADGWNLEQVGEHIAGRWIRRGVMIEVFWFSTSSTPRRPDKDTLAMMTENLPEGNRALAFLLKTYSEHPQISTIVEALPKLAEAFNDRAKATAKKLCATGDNPVSNENQDLLGACVLDLELASAFEAVLDYTGDASLASCYIDALLFAATGREAGGVPTDIEYRTGGTEKYRGVAKYVGAKRHFRLSDPVAWLFGKEYSAIVSGSALDFAYITAVNPLTLSIRVIDVKWLARFGTTGSCKKISSG